MVTIGLIREGKVPHDNRVALAPAQCAWLQQQYDQVRIVVQPSDRRCFSDQEYRLAGVEVREDVSGCDLLLGIKEVPVAELVAGKHYMFFSHTKKMQPYNQPLLRAIVDRGITLTDYECLEHEDGQRIIGFGFFAGIVGAHNGMMAYGTRTGTFSLPRVYGCHDYRQLIKAYFGLKLPNVKICMTGSGRVATGVLEVMNLLDVKEVEPEEYLARQFAYPVFVHLKGADLYCHKVSGRYQRDDFHQHPASYRSRMAPYLAETDILMNGTYWEPGVPRLFEWADMLLPDFRIQTIADISDDKNGGIPCNLGDSTIEHPVYGVDAVSRQPVDPYQKGCIDVMAVSNLPNELPRDASSYFGDQLIKHVLHDFVKDGSDVINRATMVRGGVIAEGFSYLREWAGV